MYLEVLTEMSLGTITRKTFDRALQSLPITQHEPIWDRYLEWTKKFNIPETTIPIYRRYLQYNPSYREELVNYLENISQYEEASRQLSICINDDNFIPLSGSTKHQLWMRLCDMCALHPIETSRSLKVESVIRSGINRFSDEVGRLWTRLADYYIRLGQFERARDIYEEAMQTVTTVRDFTLIFDSYLKCEENILMATMREAEELEQEIHSQGGEGEDGDGAEEGREEGDGAEEENKRLLTSLNNEIELRLARLEYLTERRPILLNSVMLRQNPNNVYEWHKRIKLYRGDIPRMLMTYMEAIKTILPSQAYGKLSTLWLGLGKLYEDNSDLHNCREVYKKATSTEIEYQTIDELAYLYCQWGEMELRHEEYFNALNILKHAAIKKPKLSLIKKKQSYHEIGKLKISSKSGEGEGGGGFLMTGGTSVHDKLHRNVKIWSFYLDLEESFGSLESCRAAYDEMIELKIITPQILLNYTKYLEEHHFYEDSFHIFEKGLILFSFPSLRIIWLEYVQKFLARYEGKKLERLRDLFEQFLSSPGGPNGAVAGGGGGGGIPGEYISEFYLQYALIEEEYGLIRHAMAIYTRALQLLNQYQLRQGEGQGGGGAKYEHEMYDMLQLYLKKTEHYYGVTKTRVIYEQAIQGNGNGSNASGHGLNLNLSDEHIKELCLQYSEMETKLGEIDRARGIFQYGSQFADPRVHESYWIQWRKFEEAHGNLDTFKDMLRIQRSIETAFSQVTTLFLCPSSPPPSMPLTLFLILPSPPSPTGELSCTGYGQCCYSCCWWC
jgi:pre-mRNA-splicing factor SYF1